MEENIGISGVGGRLQASEKVVLMYLTDAQEDNKTREKSFIQTIRHKDIFVYRDTETWVVLSFVALNPIVNLAETETHSIILFALCMPLINL
ncbi:hypothetical protein N7530_005069 [Penicillium desertorum]|uniref:Uncharacterized protein n=1 Tax=Penicillium desertorum TaxID=1303715 RepID=A0A9W9WZR1_9EURO|nr:hypothetical protein N7530_005069 [Penicillium desertorum]